METFRDWLTRQLDQHPDLNQVGLAIKLGLSQSSVSNWLRGIYVPQPENCRKLARFFNVPEKEVLIIAGHLQPNVTSDNHLAAEPRALYHTGPRARLNTLLDRLTDYQIETLATFLETLE